MKINNLAILIVIVLFLFRIWQTTGCKQFVNYKFIPLSVKINVESQRLLDYRVNSIFSRFFHNKASQGFFEITKSYVSFFEPRFLTEILGPLGILLLITAIINVYQLKKIIGFAHLAVVLASAIMVFLSINPKISFFIFASAIYSFSLWGIKFFTDTKLQRLLFIGLMFLTFWYFVFSWQMPTICNEIFFN